MVSTTIKMQLIIALQYKFPSTAELSLLTNISENINATGIATIIPEKNKI